MALNPSNARLFGSSRLARVHCEGTQDLKWRGKCWCAWVRPAIEGETGHFLRPLLSWVLSRSGETRDYPAIRSLGALSHVHAAV